MKKLLFILLVTIALSSCQVTVGDYEAPTIPTNLEGETLTDRYGRMYVLNHKHVHMSEVVYTLTKINDLVIINDTVYVEDGFNDGVEEGTSTGEIEFESNNDF